MFYRVGRQMDARLRLPPSVISAALNDPLHIFVMNADGKERRNLTGDTDLRFNSNPTWSPDGRKIAFHSQRNFKGYDIHVITAEGKNLEQAYGRGRQHDAGLFAGWEQKSPMCHTRNGDSNIHLDGHQREERGQTHENSSRC